MTKKQNVLTTNVSSVSIKVNEKLQQKSGNQEKFMLQRQLKFLFPHYYSIFIKKPIIIKRSNNC